MAKTAMLFKNTGLFVGRDGDVYHPKDVKVVDEFPAAVEVELPLPEPMTSKEVAAYAHLIARAYEAIPDGFFSPGWPELPDDEDDSED